MVVVDYMSKIRNESKSQQAVGWPFFNTVVDYMSKIRNESKSYEVKSQKFESFLY